ncbi:MAG: hypothetical protein HQL70_12115 [Magnetococcales bacterium]|nr:hypothetical protein [Magnetococcales bacterium]
MEAAPIRPFEASYTSATYVALAEVTDYHRQHGVTVRIVKSIRGGLELGDHLNIAGTVGVSFLQAPGKKIVIFLREVRERNGFLVSGPASGGMMRETLNQLDEIAQAYTAPSKVLLGKSARGRLAAAYYLATRDEVTPDNRNHIMHELVLGLEDRQLESNQAAIDGLLALGIYIQKQFGAYHPGFKLKLKQAFAQKVKAKLLGNKK